MNKSNKSFLQISKRSHRHTSDVPTIDFSNYLILDVSTFQMFIFSKSSNCQIFRFSNFQILLFYLFTIWRHSQMFKVVIFSHVSTVQIFKFATVQIFRVSIFLNPRIFRISQYSYFWMLFDSNFKIFRKNEIFTCSDFHIIHHSSPIIITPHHSLTFITHHFSLITLPG